MTEDAGAPLETPPVETAPPRGTKRGVVIGVVALVLAVVAGAAVWATTVLSGGGTQPDALVPKSAFALLKVDLDPAANQKIAARSFFGKFPKLSHAVGNTDSVFDDVLAQVVVDEDIDYTRDVKPWFDRRAAVAAYPSGGDVHVVGVLRSKDDAKARAALDKAKAHYTITKGYVVLADTQAIVDEAVRLTKTESIEDNKTYGDDVDALHGDQIAVAWADLGATYQSVKGKLPSLGLVPSTLTDQIKGRVVSGLHLSDDYAEVEALGIGLPKSSAQVVGDPALLKKLPASTVAAISVHGAGTMLGTQLAAVGGAGGPFDPLAFVDDALKQAGLTRADVLSLFGGESVLALGNLPFGPDAPRLGLVTQPKDAATAKTTGPKLAALLSGLTGIPVKSAVDGDTLYLATDEYGTELRATGGLGTSPKFTKAIGDVTAAGAVAYVDLEAAGPALIGDDPNVKPLRALGLVTGMRGDNAYARLRLVVG